MFSIYKSRSQEENSGFDWPEADYCANPNSEKYLIIQKWRSVDLARVDMIMSCQSHKLLSDTLVFRVEGPVDS